MTRSIDDLWIDTSHQLWALEGEALIEVPGVGASFPALSDVPGVGDTSFPTLSVRYKVTHLTGADRALMSDAMQLRSNPIRKDLYEDIAGVSRGLLLNNISTPSPHIQNYVLPTDIIPRDNPERFPNAEVIHLALRVMLLRPAALQLMSASGMASFGGPHISHLMLIRLDQVAWANAAS